MRTSLWHKFLAKASRVLEKNRRRRQLLAQAARRRFLWRERRLERLEDRSLLAGLNLVVSGNQTFTFGGDVEIASIVGDAQPGADNVTISAAGQIHFTGNVGGAGLHNVTVTAHDINVDPNLVISTREIAAGGNPATAASIGASGDLNFTAEHIGIGQSDSIVAQGTAGFASGNVTLTAMNSVDLDWFLGIDTALFQNTQSSAGIDVDQGATVKGKNVAFTAQAQTLKTAIQSGNLDPASNSGLARQINFVGPIAVSGNAAAVVSEATATINVHSGVVVAADENIILHTDALTDSQITTSGKYLGITFGRSAPTSTITLAGGSSFTAGLDFAAEATTETNLALKTSVPAAGDTGGLTLSLGNTNSTSLVDQQNGALVQSRNASFKATNSATISNETFTAGIRTAPDSVGATVVSGDYGSHATAQVNGTINATGSVTVAADAGNTTNHSSASGNLQSALGSNNTLSAIQTYLAGNQFVFPAAYDASHGAAFSLNRSVNEANALVGSNAIVSAGQNVTVQASSHDNADSTASAKGIALLTTAPSATAALESKQTTAATVTGATVTAGGNVTVSAANALTSSAKSAGNALLKADDHTTATITGGANVHANQNISIKADDGTQTTALAGPAAASGVANVGLGLATESITKHTEASIAGASQITADGNGSGLEISGKAVHGLALLATGHTTIAGLAAAAGSSGVAGVAGSAALHKLDETTHATIGGNSIVNQGAGDETVYVLATNDTNIFGFGGAAQNSGAIGAGGGLDAGQITKDTRASIDAATVNAKHDVDVLAYSTEHVLSLSGSLSLSGAVAIAGAAAGYSLPVTTLAVIGTGATVTAPGSVIVNADDEDNVHVIAGALTASSGSPAAGAAAGLVVLDKNTMALVDKGATVRALGTLPAATTNRGKFSVSYQPDPARIPGMVAAGLLEVVGFVFDNPIRTAIADAFNFQGDLDFLDITPVSAPPIDPDLANQRTVTDATRSIQGLAVVANSRDHVETLAAGLGTGGVLLPQFSAAALVTSNETTALIAEGAQINQGAAGAAAQALLVAAGSDTYFASMAGAAALSSGSSVASLGGAFNLAVVSNDTEAGIGPNAHVAAAGDIEVSAIASEDLLNFAASATAGDSGLLEAAASFDLLVVHDTTHAFIGAGAVVGAGGNVLVAATDDTDIDGIAGQAGLGGSVIGAGASITTTAIVKDTQAFIGQGATVDAKGNSAGLMSVFDGTTDPALGVERIHGLAVQAHSTENVFSITAAGSLSSKLGLAGAASITLLDSDTAAFIDKNAHINSDPTNANAAQSVNVSAANEATIFGLPINVTKGTLCIGLGVDIGIIDNDTTAQVRDGATIDAKQDIGVHSLDRIETDSFIANISRPDKIGAAITMSLYSLRGNITDQLSIPFTGEKLLPLSQLNTVGASNLYGDVDGLVAGLTQPGGGIRQTLDGYDGALPGIGDAGAKLGAATPLDLVKNALTTPPKGTGTTVVVAGATLHAGRDVSLTADERSNLAADTVTATDVAYAIDNADDDGTLLAVANDRAYTFTDTMAVTNVSGTIINAGRNVAVTGHVENDQSLTGTTGANFVTSSTGAVVEGKTTITAGGDVDVNAHADLFDTTWSILPRFDGKQIKSGSNMIDGSTQAVVRGDSAVTAGSDVRVNALDDVVGLTVANSFTVGQDSKNAGKFPTVGAALGFNTVNRTILAADEDSSLTATAGDVDVTATSNPWVVSVGLGIAEAEQYLVLGGSMAQNQINNTVDAHLSGHGTVTSPGTVDVEATDNAKMVSVGGAAAVASSSSGSSSDGAAAAGAAVAFNTVGNTIRAYVQGNDNESMVVKGLGIIVRGHEDVDITAVAVGGAGAEKFSLGGSYVENHLQNDIQAFVGNNAELTADRTISVVANDDGTIIAISGAAAVATDGAAVGAAISHNKNEDQVHAYLESDDPDILFQQDFDTILTADTITVAAENSQEITAVSAAGSYGDKAVINGSVSQNIISGSTRATVSDQPKLAGTSAINILATDSSSIHAVSGAAAISQGKVAAAGSVSENDIGSTTEVLLTSGTLSADSITLRAENTSSILAISGAGTYSEGLSGAGAVSLNKLNNTVNASVNGQFVTDLQADSVLVEAHNKSSIEALIASLSYGDKVALSGSITHNEDTSQVTASIIGYAGVTADKITVHSKNEPSVKSLSGAISASQTAAAGDATAINKIKVTNSAKIDGANIHGGAVTVNAETIAYIGTTAVVGSGAGNVAANASQAISEIHNQTDARITGAAAKVDGTAVAVKASDDSNIQALSGSIALSGDVAGAAAVGENHIGNQVSAIVEQGTVTATSLDVIASENDDGNDGLPDPSSDDGLNDDIQLIVIGGAGSGKVALSGSVALNDINNVVEARITDSAKTTTTGATHVRAADDSGIRVVAGNGQGSGTFAAGAAIATNDSHSTVTSTIEYGADVTAPTVEVSTSTRGNIKSAAAAGGGAGTVAADAAVSVNEIGNTSQALVDHGAHVTATGSLTIAATDTSSILSITGAGAGAGTVAIAAGVAKNLISNSVLAHASVATLDVGSATISASDTSHIEAVSVGVAVAGSVAVTGGVGINEIGNTVEAKISGDSVVTATKDVTVHAHDDSTVSAITGQASGALVGVGGAASYSDVQNHVRSFIDGSQVHSQGSVFVQADELATIEEIAVGANAGFVGIGGNVSVNSLQSSTEAYIHDSQVDAANNLVVTAEAENALGLVAGQVAAGFVGAAGTVVVNTMENTTRAYIDDSTVSALGKGEAVQVKKWNSTTGELTLESIHGLAVVASSVERPHDPINGAAVPTLAAINGAGGFVGAQGLVSVNTVNDTTDAFISRSQVNSEDNFGGQVLVRAHTDDYLNIISGGAAGGFVGIGATVDRSQITSTTRAFITNEDEIGKGANAASSVYGTGVEVSTVSREKIDEVIIGVAGGAGALAGTVSVADISATNEAFVDNSTVNSKGYLRVLADDTAEISPTVGTFTGGALGVGAAVSVNSIKTTVRAQALGASLNATGSMTIQADSDEKIRPLVGTGSLGAVALAGAVTVDTIETTIEALAMTDKAPTLINQDPKFQKGGAYNPGSGQTVTIKADDTATITGNTGTIAGGGAGIGASIDVGAIRNRTVADVGSQTQIDAVGSVNVLAHADHEMTSNVVAFTGGLVGLSGAVSVLSLGGDIAADAMNEFTHQGKNSNQTLLGETNDSLKTPDVSQTIDYNKNDGGDPLAQRAAQHVKDLDDASVSDELSEKAGTDRITAAIVDHSPSKASGAAIRAGGNVTIKAENLYHVSQLTGTAAGGLAAAGAGISVATIHNSTKAYVGTDDTILAGGDVTIHASDEEKQQPTTFTSLGAAAGLFEVNANVVTMMLDTDTDAYLSGNASIAQAGAVAIEAVQTSNINATGKGYGGGAAAAGGVIVNATVTSNVNANVYDLATIGGDNQQVGSLAVTATATNTLIVESDVGHIGGLAFNGGTGYATVTANVGAKIGDANVDASGDTQVNATSTTTADSTVKELAGGLVSGGLALPQTAIGGAVLASIGDGAAIDSNTLTVQAQHTSTTHAKGDALGVGLGTVSETNVDAGIHVGTTAEIDAAKVMTLGGINVTALATATADAKSGQKAVGAGTYGESPADAVIDGDVTAVIRNNANINAGDLYVTADRTATATADARALGEGLVSADAAAGTATIHGNIDASIGDATVVTFNNVVVEAGATQNATASAGQIAAALIAAVGGAAAPATIDGNVQAYIDTGADVTAGGVLNGGVQVIADATNHATSTVGATSAGLALFGASAAAANALVDVDTRAFINPGHTHAKGDILVQANSTNQADASGDGEAIGLVAVGAILANATVNGVTRTAVAGVLTTDVGNLTVETLDTDSHAIATSESAGGGIVEVSGAESHAKLYSDSAVPHLRALINDGANVNVGGDILVRVNTTDAVATATTTGVSVDLVHVNAKAGGSIATADLSPTIRAAVANNGNITAGGNVTIEALKTGGQATASAYASDASLLFGLTGATATANAKADVAATVGDSAIDADNDVLLHADAKNAARATAKNSAFAGLLGIGNVAASATASGKTAATADDGSQLSGRDIKVNAVGRDYATALSSGTGLAMIAAQASQATATVNPTVMATIGDNASALANRDIFVTAESRGEGDALAQVDTKGLGTVGLSNAHVELTPTVDTVVSVNAQLAGRDITLKALSGLAKPDNSGDGTSSAKALGAPAADFLGSQGGKATITAAPEVYVTIAKSTAGPSAAATRDLLIAATSNVTVDAFSTNGQAGAAGGSNASAGDDIDNTSEVVIADGAKLTAGDDLTITASANHDANAHADANSVGGINIVESDAFVDIDYSTRVDIGTAAQLSAGDQLQLAGNTKSKGYVNADSLAEGGIGKASANDSAEDADGSNDLEVGGGQRGVRIGFHEGLTQIDVGVNAKITADIVKLNACASTDGNSIGTAISKSGGSDIDALARVELHDDASVTIEAGAQVTGTSEVDLIADIGSISSQTDAYADEQGNELFSGASATTINETQTMAEVNAAAGAVITTQDLKVKGLLDGASQSVSETTSAADKHDNVLGKFSPDRVITFDADVELLSGRAILIIDSDGSVLQQEGVTFTSTPTSINVNPIVNTSPGTASFETPQYFNVPNLLFAPEGLVRSLKTISGDDPFVINFHETLQEVHLENRSAKDLVVGDINVVNTTVKPTVTINAESIQYVASVNPLTLKDAFGFDVTHSFPGTPIEIEQNHPSSGNGIELTGLIDNPVGSTALTSDGGGVSMAAGALIRTNTLDVKTENNVGSAANRLKVELVRSLGQPTGLDITATGQVWLDLRGLLRDTTVGSFVVNTGFIDGSNVDLLLRPSLKQTTASPPVNYLVDVYEVVPDDHTLTKHHFRPDNNAPLSLPLGVFGTGGTEIDSSYSFPLLSSTGNINIVGLASAAAINIVGNTNLYGVDDAAGTGKIDASASGDITLAEAKGDLQIGQIISTLGDVTLVAKTGNIVDQDNDTQADGVGNAITFTAAGGGIGSPDNPIEIDSDHNHAGGLVNASAQKGIYLTEVQLNLNAGLIVSSTADIGLTTVRGSIVDGLNDSDVNIQGVNIALTANNGDLGEQNDSLEICTGHPTPGVASLSADGQIFVTNCGDLKLQSAVAAGGSLTIYAAGHLDVVDNGHVSARGAANLLAAGDIIATDSSEITASQKLTIAGDVLDSDAGVGTHIVIGGLVNAPQIDIAGGSDADEITLHGTWITKKLSVIAAGGDDLVDASALSTSITINGGAGDDSIMGGSGNDLLLGGDGNDHLDGGAGDDQIYGDAVAKSRYQNGINRFNVNNDADGVVSPVDALYVINFINARITNGELPADHGPEFYGYLDVNGDDFCSPSDALYVINYLNASPADRAGQVQTSSAGAGDDVLLGGSGNDRLSGDQGSDVLIGGVDGDSLYGADGEDILIGGSLPTADTKALDALITLWRQDQPQAQRISQLRIAGLDAPNVLDDAVADQLFGQGDLDWFWDFTPDTTDQKKGEQSH